MDFVNVFKDLFVLFIVAGVGYTSSRLGVITNRGAHEFSNVLMKLTFPALIIASMNQPFSRELLISSVHIVIISVCVHAVFVLTAYLGRRRFKNIPHGQMAVLELCLIFGNTTFTGYPVVNAMYGQLGLFYASAFNFIVIVLLFTYGILLLSGHSNGNLFKRLLNPGLIAVILGYGLFFTQIKLPYVILTSLQWVGNLTIPLAMLIVGNSLAGMPLKEIFADKRLYAVTALRLLIFPLIIMVVLKMLRVDPLLTGVAVMMSATPAMLMAGVFARSYGCDGSLGDRGVLLNHLLAFITIPFLIFLLEIIQI
ncbi:MAG: AEC family transporter [Clostridia bacterium]|jgi:predicted permease|nr:AEC family transporter [Clostridia bacterium]